MIRRFFWTSGCVLLAGWLVGCQPSVSELNEAYVRAVKNAEAAMTADRYTTALSYYNKAISDGNLIIDKSSSELAVDLVSGEKKLGRLSWYDFNRKADELKQLAEAEESLISTVDYILGNMDQERRLNHVLVIIADGEIFGQASYDWLYAQLQTTENLRARLHLISAMIASDLNSYKNLKALYTSEHSHPSYEEDIKNRIAVNIERLRDYVEKYLEQDDYKSTIIGVIEMLEGQPLDRDSAVKISDIIDLFLAKSESFQLDAKLIQVRLLHKAGLAEKSYEVNKSFWDDVRLLKRYPLSGDFMESSIKTMALTNNYEIINWILDNNRNEFVDHVNGLYYAMHYAQRFGNREASLNYANEIFQNIRRHNLNIEDKLEAGHILEIYGAAGKAAIQVNNEVEFEKIVSNFRNLGRRDSSHWLMGAFKPRMVLHEMLRSAGENQKIEAIIEIEELLSKFPDDKNQVVVDAQNDYEVALALAIAKDFKASEAKIPSLLNSIEEISHSWTKVLLLAQIDALQDRYQLELSSNSRRALVRLVHDLEPISEFWVESSI